jgi:hypothetical protein
LVREAPDAALLGAVAVGEALVEHALLALGRAAPAALHVDDEAAHHLARAVGEDAVGQQRAIEVAAQVQQGALGRVVGDDRAAAAGQHGGQHRRSGGDQQAPALQGVR